MDSIINMLEEKLNHAEEFGINDLKEYVDTVPLFVVCQQCGRSRPIEIPMCNHCEGRNGNAIGFYMTEE